MTETPYEKLLWRLFRNCSCFRILKLENWLRLVIVSMKLSGWFLLLSVLILTRSHKIFKSTYLFTYFLYTNLSFLVETKISESDLGEAWIPSNYFWKEGLQWVKYNAFSWIWKALPFVPSLSVAYLVETQTRILLLTSPKFVAKKGSFFSSLVGGLW